MMPPQPHSLVRLLTDRYREKGVRAGATGVLLDIYDEAYEVEFSRPDGTTIAWFAIPKDEVEPILNQDMTTAKQLLSER